MPVEIADAADARWDRSFFGHPRGLATLFMTEMWERFSYYGMRAVLYGGILITAGEFCLMAPSVTVFYLGLVLLMAGTGFLKGNVSTIVGQLYARDDVRRDSGFSIFYMGINIGAFLSPIFCGYIG